MKRLIQAILLACAALPAAKNLEVYFIDVEGGQSTLIVSPSGESLLVDAGYSGHAQRDANRIAAVAKLAGRGTRATPSAMPTGSPRWRSLPGSRRSITW